VQGAAPTLSGNTLSFAAATRGVFSVTATDTQTGRSGSADFVVAAPATAATRPDVLAIATFGETLAAVGDLMRQASAASDAGTRRARVISAVQRWRAFNQSVLRLSTPFAPEGGLPPLPRDLTERGMAASSEDQVNLVMLENGVARVRELIDAIRQPSTPIAEVERRFAELSAAVSGLALNQPGEFGLVMAQPEYRYLISRLLPDWMNALMNEMALATGQPALAQQVEPSASGRTAYVASLLAEELTTITVNSVLDQINFIGKFKTDVTTQAYRGAMLVGLASHLRTMLAGQELVEVVGGASLSIRRFATPYSFIEGFDFDVKYPILNNVVFLGPETVGAVTDLADAIKNLKLGDMAASVKAFFDLKSKVEALRDAGDPFAGNALQVPTDAEVGCVFTTAPSCTELHFASGFFPVYSYNAPPPLPPSVVGLPSPIIVIAMSTTGQFYLSTPPFIPYRPGED
ncbi:MAG TPA: hypothetical protein VEQ17_06500, partial [Steroidobacteraceae bacterium]|nr:hypothetical protein [Steroidobacteraceae bacterium]